MAIFPVPTRLYHACHIVNCLRLQQKLMKLQQKQQQEQQQLQPESQPESGTPKVIAPPLLGDFQTWLFGAVEHVESPFRSAQLERFYGVFFQAVEM